MKKTILSIVLALCAIPAFAHDSKGVKEFSIYGGVNHVTDGGGNHPIWGVQMGVGVSARATIFGEFDHTKPDGGNVTDYLGGVKFSLVESEKAEPYALIGFGATHYSSGPFSDNDPSLHIGGGVRIFVSKKWGIVPEIRWVRGFDGAGDSNSVRFTGGVFFNW
jgi:hypothetical protein